MEEFTIKINLENLTSRELIQALNKIPEDYQDSIINISVLDEYPDYLSLSMVIDDAEEARAKWRRGDPDYMIFMDFEKEK